MPEKNAKWLLLFHVAILISFIQPPKDCKRQIILPPLFLALKQHEQYPRKNEEERTFVPKGAQMKSVHKELAREVLAAYERMREKEPEIIEKNIPRGTSIIHQDQPINHVFIILSGKMKTHFDTPKGTEFLVAVEGEGVFVGEVEALTNEPATCSVTALTESKVAVIQQKTYQRRLDDDHSFALLMNRIVTCRLQLMTKRAAIHLSYPLEYSVLKLLETTVHSSGRTVSVSKEGIANYFGTSIRSINRILKELQNKGILSPSTQIEIESMEALEQALRLYDEQY